MSIASVRMELVAARLLQKSMTTARARLDGTLRTICVALSALLVLLVTPGGEGQA